MYDQAYITEEAPRVPFIQVDGNAIYLERRDPFGHVFIRLEKGELPEKYQNAYTTMPLAEIAAQQYAEERRVASEILIKEGKIRQKK